MMSELENARGEWRSDLIGVVSLQQFNKLFPDRAHKLDSNQSR